MVPVKIISMATTVHVYLGIQEEIVLSVSHNYIYLSSGFTFSFHSNGVGRSYT